MICITDDKHYKSIADAIRAKNGKTNTYNPAEMASAILAIESGGNSGGGGSGDVSVTGTDYFYTYDPNKEYETVDLFGDIMYKISDKTFDTTEFDTAFFIGYDQNNVAIIPYDYIGASIGVMDFSDEIPGAFCAGTQNFQSTITLYSFTEDVRIEEGEFALTIPKGVWYGSTVDEFTRVHFAFLKE